MKPALRLPAEWEPQSAILIAWPHADTDWAARLGEVEDTYIALVAAITRFQPVLICVVDADLRAYARARLASARVDMARVRFVEIAYNDTWLRDSGPITLVSEIGHSRIESGTGSTATQTHRVRHVSGPGVDDFDASSESPAAHPCAAESHPEKSFRLLDFRFTGWGGKFDASLDDLLVEGLHEAGMFLNSSRQAIDFYMEGGAIDSDGAGTLLTTWRCLHERHPEAGRNELGAQLAGWLKQDRVLWLDHGVLEGDDTDAHIDTLARFAAEDAIVFQRCDDPADSHYTELQAMAAELAALRTRENRPYRLFPLPWAQPIVDGGRRLAASYANFLIINGAVLMPAYGDAADSTAVAVLEKAFPDREIVSVPCRPLIWQNGSLHCITMQLPQGVVA